ncbi:MAG: DNA translocase FtsK [Candidatus Tantalella remota]|nr:DNA translocase FtsK [Candidatus Tantalella remota]
MDQTRKNEIIAVVLFAASLFLFLSIFTFSEQDLSFYSSAPNAVPRNATGVAGAFIGGVLLFLMGRAAYVIPILIMIWGVSRLLQMEHSKVFFKLFGTIVLVTAVSASLSMFADSSRAMAFSSGGLIGSVTSTFLLEYLGRLGASVFITAMIILSVLIATEFLLLPIVVRVIRFISGTPERVRSWIPERPARRQEPSPPAKSRIASAKEQIAKKLETVRKQVEQARKGPSPGSAGGSEPKIVVPKKIEKAAPKPVRVAPVASGEDGEEIEYKLPGMELLKAPSKVNSREAEDDLKKKAAILEGTLLEFGVEAKVVKINRGPVITLYELEPAPGTKVNKITSLSDNISLAMKSANIRIVAPLPGKGTVGIEVPNAKSELVLLRDIIETTEYTNETSAIKLAIGKDISGVPIVTDLAKMPHLLIAGATGSGKTVCINAVICSILYNASPSEVKFLMIDPKRVELLMFAGIPHLVCPIVTSPKKAAAALGWVVSEMERRYEVFAGKGVRNIGAYKDRQEEDDENLPYIIVIVDELADLMMVAQQDVEGSIMRIAQLSRAAGIHMILATQRPSVNVITGVIKANFPARISFQVASKVDSRTVLDVNGADKLLGRGDMLFMEPGESSVIRGQCSLVEDSELRDVVNFIKDQAPPQYIAEAVEKQETKATGVAQEKDDLYREAVKIVIVTKQASVSMIQRKLRVGYTRAARMVDIMEDEGIVGPYNGSKPREILIDDLELIEE